MIKNLLAILSTAIFLISCTFTTRTSKDPIFSKNSDSLRKDLIQIASFEQMSLHGVQISEDRKSSFELEIEIVNCKNLPTDDDQAITMGKFIASTIKKALQDQNEYDIYKISFIKKENYGNTTRTSTKTKIFNSADL